ncbi:MULTISPECIES: PAS domain-containing protein [Methylobacterium]|uniref:PAS domain-containing protein n=1 Tax=Methylobacterium TaxID=407 RepID=UPI0013EDDF59|nr:PAS domain-containing protein [Methylobacterium sp. DB0501]NGM38665.1 PAS domain-containing protein [Methylobacterium sp. DB0501]
MIDRSRRHGGHMGASGRLLTEEDLRPRFVDIPQAVGSWDWDIPNDRIYCDDIVASLYGIDSASASYSGCSLDMFVSGHHPGDRDWMNDAIRGAMQGTGILVAEYRTQPEEGVEKWALVRARYYHDAQGRPMRARGVIVDITNSKLDGQAPSIAQDLPDMHLPDMHPLDRAAELCISAREVIATARKPFLLRLVDMVLLELGRELGKLVQ